MFVAAHVPDRIGKLELHPEPPIVTMGGSA